MLRDWRECTVRYFTAHRYRNDATRDFQLFSHPALAHVSPRKSPELQNVNLAYAKAGEMMDATDQPPASELPAHLSKIPIAQLSPTLDQLEHKCIYAAVTLVWPYSSSTKSLSLLLAEPDFRLRRSNGQVKVTFHGRVAERVAESAVGIGDEVRLALKHARLVSNDAAQQTPGRFVAWDVYFDYGVSLEVSRVPREPTK